MLLNVRGLLRKTYIYLFHRKLVSNGHFSNFCQGKLKTKKNMAMNPPELVIQGPV